MTQRNRGTNQWTWRQSTGIHPCWTEKKKKKKSKTLKSQDSLRDLWDNIKYTKVHITRVPEGEERKRAENLFEAITAKTFPNLGKETDIQIEEAHKVPNKMNPKILHQDTWQLTWEKLKIESES